MQREYCMSLRNQETVCLERKRILCHVMSQPTHRLDRSPMLHISHAKQYVCMTCRNAKWRERRSRVDKDVHRTDRQQPFFSEPRSHNTKQLRNILLTYVQYNHDLGYCQVSITFCYMSFFLCMYYHHFSNMHCSTWCPYKILILCLCVWSSATVCQLLAHPDKQK